MAYGRIDEYLDKNALSEYVDGIILVKEAGGFCTDYSMGENILKKKEICAGNPSIHNNVIKIIKKNQ